MFFVEFAVVKYNTIKPLFAFKNAHHFETDKKFEAQKKVLDLF